MAAIRILPSFKVASQGEKKRNVLSLKAEALPFPQKRPMRWLGFLCAVGVLSGCSNAPYSPVCLNSVALIADPQANENSATAVDVLVVYREDALNMLAKLSSHEYYKKAEQIRKDNPDIIDAFHWEIVPGQMLVDQPVTLREIYPVGALVFARYGTPGDHRARVGEVCNITIRLMKDDFVIRQQKAVGR